MLSAAGAEEGKSVSGSGFDLEVYFLLGTSSGLYPLPPDAASAHRFPASVAL